MKGVYLIGCIETKEEKFLKSVNVIKNVVLKACRTLGLKVVDEKYHVFKSSNGITYCFILSQSHFVVHTWPEECKIFFDIFTCNEEVNESRLVDALSKEFNGKVKRFDKVTYS